MSRVETGFRRPRLNNVLHFHAGVQRGADQVYGGALQAGVHLRGAQGERAAGRLPRQEQGIPS
eukprot:396828-Prorocentrum_minimum.AAC.1